MQNNALIKLIFVTFQHIIELRLYLDLSNLLINLKKNR